MRCSTRSRRPQACCRCSTSPVPTTSSCTWQCRMPPRCATSCSSTSPFTTWCARPRRNSCSSGVRGRACCLDAAPGNDGSAPEVGGGEERAERPETMRRTMRPYLDKAAPEVWKSISAYSAAVAEHAAESGLSLPETELIKVRASQMNACAYCVELHSREARTAGVPQQKLDLLPAWRETSLFDERETAVLAVAEAATRMPLSEESKADLWGARRVLGDAAFA